MRVWSSSTGALQDLAGVRDRQIHRAPVLIPGSPPRSDPKRPLTGLRAKPDRLRVRRTLQPLTGGGTNIVPALDRAGKLLGREGERAQIVLLFSDGESGETAAELREVVAHLPVGCVHVVVLGDELPAQWLDVPVGSVTALTELRTADDVEWVLARALYRSLSLEWAGPHWPPTSSGGVTSLDGRHRDVKDRAQ